MLGSVKSKHLEMTTCRLCSFECNFVHLRMEEYADGADHRALTEVRVRTPDEDVARRDFTVNALFYRFDSDGSGGGRVKDWTERGLADLAAGVIRTPPLGRGRDEHGGGDGDEDGTYRDALWTFKIHILINN